MFLDGERRGGRMFFWVEGEEGKSDVSGWREEGGGCFWVEREGRKDALGGGGVEEGRGAEGMFLGRKRIGGRMFMDGKGDGGGGGRCLCFFFGGRRAIMFLGARGRRRGISG